MFDKWLKLPAHYYLKITALLILAVGVCLHNTLMSIGAIWIIANWLIEAKFKVYWNNFKANKELWALYAFLILGLLSMMWSDDQAYGWKDFGQKAPLFVVPLALGTGERIEKKVTHFVLFTFLFALCLTSVINYYRFHEVLGENADIRMMSYFISHVRYSTLVVIGICAAIYLTLKYKKWMPLFAMVGLWLTYYTLKSQTVNGYFLLVILFLFSVIYAVNHFNSKWLKWSVAVVGGAGIVFSGWYVKALMDTYQAPHDVLAEEVPLKTVNGRLYMHDYKSTERENGNLIWMFVQPVELEQEWNKRSEIKYDSLDRKGQPMFGTLLRYMTSKNMTKDSVGVWELTQQEIEQIQNGRTTIASNQGFKSKLHDLMFQYDLYVQDGDPNGHSLLQRLEHFKVALCILENHWLLGVGIGDVQLAFDDAYTSCGSALLKENQHRAHNQFLTFWISHGLIGLILIIFFLIYPLYRSENNYLKIGILLTLMASFLFQDAVETQAGVTLFGLFYCLMNYTSWSSSSSDESE